MSTIPPLATPDSQPIQQLILPASWAEFTLSQYLAAHTRGSAHAPVLRLSGLLDEVLSNLTAEDAEGLLLHLRAALEEDVLAALLPTPGLLEIGSSAWGLYEQAQAHLTATPEAHPLAHGAYLYALYRAPTGSRANEQQLAAAHAAVLAQPVTAVYADCLHFLASYQRAVSGTSLPGPAQPGILRIVRPVAPAPQTWRARLGNLWNPTTRLQA
jgi:hypothetical protein